MESSDNYSINVNKHSFRFNSAHFLVKPWEPLHGHNYKVALKIKGNDQLMDGMVLDFTFISPFLTKICNELHHKILIPKTCELLLIKYDSDFVFIEESENPNFNYKFPIKDCSFLEIPQITPEMLSHYLLCRLMDSLKKEKTNLENIRKIKLTVFEMDGFSASYTKIIKC